MRQGGYFLPIFPIFFPSAWWYYLDRRGGRSSPLGGRKLSPAKKGENALVTETVSLELEPREVLGKKVKQLRRAGSVPVHLYGPSIESRALQCELSRLVRAVSQAGGNTPITLTVRGEEGERLAFAREIQWNPTRGDMLHVDFLVVERTRRVSAQVPVVFTGESPGAQQVWGTVVQQVHNVQVEALPLEMPNQLEVDLAQLAEPDQVIRVGDITLPADATMQSDPDEVVARIELPRAVEEEKAVEEEAEAEVPADSGDEQR